MKNKSILLSLVLLASFTPMPVLAEPAEQAAEQKDYSGNLTGDWGGTRRSLENAGVST